MARGRPVTLSDNDLLATARDVFLEQGLDATSAEIARRAGISESVIFHRYKTKEALFISVLERQIAQLLERLEQLAPVVGEGEVGEHLFRLGMALIERMQTTLPLFMLAFSSPMKMNVLHERMCRAHPSVVRAIRLLAGYFEAEARCGRLRPVDTEILARTFLGGVRQYVVSEYIERTGERLPMTAASYVRGMVDILLEGVRVRPPTPRRAGASGERTRQ